ncbi:NAD(P)/FAD-dependent oxidoreductase [uncultured Jatrophihabitans sp.]|uniref:NAD(P)/FAD-dependent oxidoreductase n=1 Tax=uncultured Jatrophihabitans sp. TaxID=1610747 RepID=UPI0035CC2445
MTGSTADVVIVGSRCSGAPLATHLARAGVRVTLLDKARFPSDTASTHIIQPRGTAALERLGVLERLRAEGAADIARLTVHYADVRLEAVYDSDAAAQRLSTGRTAGLSIRRPALDAALLEIARDNGVDVRPRTPVTDMLRDGSGRVTGVRTREGTVTARLVVGADGRDSFVARAVGARKYATYSAPRFAAWSYYRGARADAGRLRIGRFGTTALIATPTDNDLLLVGVVPAMAEREQFLADRDGGFAQRLRHWPELADVVQGARREGPMRIVPDWQAYFRESAGPGWVLVGDAGHFKDPSAAQGITDALRQAEGLAASITSGLDTDVDAATQAWWRARDRDCRDMHWFARDMGAAGPTTPAMTEVVREVAATDSMLLAQVLNRDVPSSAVVTTARVGRAAAAALHRHPAALPALARESARVTSTRARWATGAVRGRYLRHGGSRIRRPAGLR